MRDVPLDVQAQEINKSVMCPVCPSETIDQSQVQLAEQMRTIVREKLAVGESREEILQFFVDRYGEDVLAAPSKRGFNLLVWLVPPGALAAAGVVLYTVLLGMRRRSVRMPSGAIAADMPDEQELEPYLQRVDEEMRRFLQSPSSDDPGRPSGRPQPGVGEQARS